MKVLHLFNQIEFSGAEIMYSNAAELFQQNNITLYAFSTGKEEGNYINVFKDRGIKTWHKPINFYPLALKGIRYYIALYKFIKREKVDILHIHRSNLYFAAAVSRMAGISCVKTQHSTFRNRWFTLPIAIVRRLISRNLLDVTFQTIGETVYRNELNYYKNPSVRINNWIDTEKFYPVIDAQEKIAIRKELGIPEDAFALISTGSCSHVKNHNDIIKALAVIKTKANFLYVHLGNGSLEQEEKILAKELGIEKQILFLGTKENVRDYLIASDVFTMTSKYEGLGNAALEAMACGIPCILYNIPGLRDLAVEENNNMLIESNFQELAQKIIHYQENPVVVKKYAEHALKNVMSNYSMQRNASEIVSLYKTIRK
ncbi:glycosyltransferase [Prolixibacter sp. NT017]|uniref:glycosyltransferase n=1 Tax=Prolixibacter sp. NT017 TaxID=2652390 RepID=UPI001288230F|nr:glycosyltransferase [Prolixibacter sp. NT017]GET24469.1 glycosyl transferase [Prolixibacter sp. NT017]